MACEENLSQCVIALVVALGAALTAVTSLVHSINTRNQQIKEKEKNF